MSFLGIKGKPLVYSYSILISHPSLCFSPYGVDLSGLHCSVALSSQTWLLRKQQSPSNKSRTRLLIWYVFSPTALFLYILPSSTVSLHKIPFFKFDLFDYSFSFRFLCNDSIMLNVQPIFLPHYCILSLSLFTLFIIPFFPLLYS